MNTYEQYLQQRLEQFKTTCDDAISIYKEQLKRASNKKLYLHVKQAEANLEESKNFYIQRFRKNMTELEMMRKRDGDKYKTMYDRLEESHKKGLEIGLQAAQNIWGSLISYLNTYIQ